MAVLTTMLPTASCPADQRMDLYPPDHPILCFANMYPLESDSSGEMRYHPFKQLASSVE